MTDDNYPLRCIENKGLKRYSTGGILVGKFWVYLEKSI